MSKKIKTHKEVRPMIYAYIKPESYDENKPEIKVGYTEQEVDKRIKEQSHTVT